MPKTKTDEAASEVQSVGVVSDSDNEQPVDLTFATLYAKAQVPFEKTHQRQIPGGRMLTYITGEQAVSRMNEVYGPHWDWSAEKPEIVGDEIYVQGTLSVTVFETVKANDRWAGTTINRSGFGGSTIKRKRDGAVLSLGNDIKAADTDAFKKAAAKFGVGLYLYERTSEDELPVYESAGPVSTVPQQAPSNLAPVSFPTNNSSGTQTVGVIRALSPKGTGINVNDTWYNTSKFNPIDLTPYQKGQTVVINHAPGKTFIDGLSLAGPAPSTQGAQAQVEDEEEVAAF